MRKLASLTFAGAMALAAAGLATSANATNFVGTDTISAYPYGGTNTDNGLGIVISDPTDLNFNLTNVGDHTSYISLFHISTTEGSAQWDDLLDSHPITLSFNFSQPLPGSTGGFGGDTKAVSIFIASWGQLTWDDQDTLLDFGSGYQLGVHLQSDSETFNRGPGLNFGAGPGADVKAKFTLLALPTAVPEPATWGMMIMGFGMAGATIRRRRTAVAAA
jgi:hypothetical protein